MTSPSSDSYDCLCVGIVVADWVCAPIPRMPAGGELAVTERLSLSIGGCAANVAGDLGKLGRNVGIVGRVGDDVFGLYVRQTLQSAGVRTEHLREMPGVQTAGTQVINVLGEDRRFIHAFGANALFDGSEVTDELIRSTRILYVGGFLIMPRLQGPELARLFKRAREANVTTVLDVVIADPRETWENLAQVLPETDCFVPNSDEGLLLTGERDPWRQAERFRQAGAKTVIITCGAEGAVLVSDRARLKSPVFRVEYLDGTGSGDAFAAGYMHGLLEGLPEAECLEMGSALGASCVRAAGATTGVFTRSELEAFLRRERLGIESWPVTQ